MDQISNLEISNIRPSNIKLGPLSEEAVIDLVKSIKGSRLLQPIMVRPFETWYEVVFGMHRLEVCNKAIPGVNSETLYWVFQSGECWSRKT